MILYKYINKKINKTTKTQHRYKARHKMKIRYEKYAKKNKHLKYIIGSLSKLFISLSGDPNCSHFSELRYQKKKKWRDPDEKRQSRRQTKPISASP